MFAGSSIGAGGQATAASNLSPNQDQVGTASCCPQYAASMEQQGNKWRTYESLVKEILPYVPGCPDYSSRI